MEGADIIIATMTEEMAREAGIDLAELESRPTGQLPSLKPAVRIPHDFIKRLNAIIGRQANESR